MYLLVAHKAKTNLKKMGNNKANKERKLGWYMKAPIRILIKIRDFYLQGITQCSGTFDYGVAMGCPTPNISTLPKSFSTNSTKSSNNDDYNELLRVASTRSVGSNNIQQDPLRKQQVTKSPMTGPDNMSRSRSVNIGRIDEDEPCEFEEDVKVNTDVYPRSRSYAVSRRSRAF